MARDFNFVILSGRLVENPEVKAYQGKDKKDSFITKFRLAVNESEKNTNFFNVTVFNRVGGFLEKGQKVVIKGRLSQNNFKTKEGKNASTVEIIADEVQIGNKAQQGEETEEVAEEKTPF
jgi:single stranded DNA-binding protein